MSLQSEQGTTTAIHWLSWLLRIVLGVALLASLVGLANASPWALASGLIVTFVPLLISVWSGLPVPVS